MPGWSTAIAYEFLVLAVRDGTRIDQAKLQKLVYIAHGLRLALSGQPLTGDRPEAWPIGPVYRRVADVLRLAGDAPLSRTHLDQILAADQSSELDEVERDLIACVLQDYAGMTNASLSQITRGGRSPWAAVYDEGQGNLKDIPHGKIHEQFVKLAAKIDRPGAHLPSD